MIYISHRGNTNGKFESYENEPNYIDSAINQSYDVEVDVWFIDGILCLGHDNPQYEVDFRWFINRINFLWIHCKNLEALDHFASSSLKFKYFWHQEDDFTLTSCNKIWTYPGKELTKKSIIVANTKEELDNIKGQIYGVCTDFPSYAKMIYSL